jgi:N-acetylmuramoyl-L-alanine amidase
MNMSIGTGMKRAIVTAAILAGSAVLPSKIIVPDSEDYSKNSTYIVSALCVESKLKSENATIVIDPGHDDKYIGYHTKNKKEEVLNLELSKRLEELLKEDGGNVHLTRDSGTRINTKNSDINRDGKVSVKDELFARSDYIRNINSDCDIVIHYNAYPRSKKVNGTEIYFYGIRSKRQIDDNRLNFTRPQDCRIYSEPSLLLAERLGQYMNEQGIKATVIGSDMRILEENIDKAIILLEVGYLTNPSDFKNWTTSEGQIKMASLLKNFFSENIGYIKKSNNDYLLKKNLTYILKPQQETASTNFEKMMNELYWKK